MNVSILFRGRSKLRVIWLGGMVGCCDGLMTRPPVGGAGCGLTTIAASDPRLDVIIATGIINAMNTQRHDQIFICLSLDQIGVAARVTINPLLPTLRWCRRRRSQDCAVCAE